MPTVQKRAFTRSKLVPYYNPADAWMQHVNLAPATYAQGTILGQITSAADAVQTASDSVGAITAGTFTISGVNPISGEAFTTAPIAYNANNAAVKAALELVLGPGATVTVGGSGLPGNDTTFTFGGTLDSRPVPLMVVNNAGLTGGILTIANTTTGRSAGSYAAYATGNSDGTETAKCILPYACVAGSDGRITIGGTDGSYFEESMESIECYFSGIFKTTDLVGLDAAGVVDLNGVIKTGTVADGILAF